MITEENVFTWMFFGSISFSLAGMYLLGKWEERKERKKCQS